MEGKPITNWDGEETGKMPVSILDIAKSRGVKEEADGSISGQEFERVGLAIMGGCKGCHAAIAAYNAYPSHSGYWACDECIGDTGFETAEEFNREYPPPVQDAGEAPCDPRGHLRQWIQDMGIQLQDTDADRLAWAQYKDLIEAACRVLDLLENMTSIQFEKGGDQEWREKLRKALIFAEGESYGENS